MSKNKLIPALRFPEFLEDGAWEERKLGEVCIMQAGKFVSASEITNKFSNGLYPCYGGNGLRGYTNTFTHTGAYSLIGRQGALCGNVTLVDGKFYATEHALVVAPKNDIDTIWLFYVLVRMNLNQYATGQAQPGLSVSNLDQLKLFAPEKPAEQQKIAACLSSLDEIILAENQKLALLKDHKKGLMQNLFPQEGEKTPKVRFPEFLEDGAWEERKLGEVCNMQAGKFVAASEIRDKFGNGLHPCYGGNGLRGYTNSFTHTGVYSLIGRQGALCGNVILVDGKFHATEHAVVVTPKNNIDTIWLFYVLERMNLNQYATGQAQPGLSVSNLDQLKLFAPEKPAEQQKIAACLSSLDALIAAQAEKIAQLQLHKKGLMQGLFPKTSD